MPASCVARVCCYDALPCQISTPMRRLMRRLHLQRYLITGLLTFVPLWLTWVVFKFVFTLLTHVGEPAVDGTFAVLSASVTVSGWPPP